VLMAREKMERPFGYIPTIVRLMKDWYSFHSLSEKDLETICSLPWVHGKSFLALHHWYIG